MFCHVPSGKPKFAYTKSSDAERRDPKPDTAKNPVGNRVITQTTIHRTLRWIVGQLSTVIGRFGGLGVSFRSGHKKMQPIFRQGFLNSEIPKKKIIYMHRSDHCKNEGRECKESLYPQGAGGRIGGNKKKQETALRLMETRKPQRNSRGARGGCSRALAKPWADSHLWGSGNQIKQKKEEENRKTKTNQEDDE